MTAQAAPVPPARNARIVALHTGTVLGLPHRLALVAIGLPPLAMGWLGVRLWWRPRQVRRRAAAA